MNESAFRFGEYCLIPARRELWRSDELVQIQPKVLDTLICLVQRRERAVSRDELVASVWGRMNVTDNLLGQIVSRARQLVGDNGEAQHSIRTVPRFGYRWVREVELLSADAGRRITDAEIATEQTAPGLHVAPIGMVRIEPHGRWSVSTSTLLLLLFVLVVSFAGWGVIEIRSDGSSRAMASSIPGDETSWSSGEERLAMFRAALASEQLDVARAIFADLTDREWLQPEIRYENAVLALKEGRTDSALAAFTSLARDLGDDGASRLIAGKALYGAGQAEFHRSQWNAARKYYGQAINVLDAETDPDARATVGLAWSSLGRLHTNSRALDEAEAASNAIRALA